MSILEKDTHEAKILVLKDEENQEEFVGKMIRHVKDPLFLPAAGPSAGALCEGGLGFDISGLLPLERALENRVLTAEEITGMIIRLNNAILVLEAHLLGDENILLSPDRVYVGPGTTEPVFCLALSADGSFEDRLRPLIREIFLHADTENPETLRQAAELFKVSLRKHYRMHDLMDVLENGVTVGKETENNALHVRKPELLTASAGSFRPSLEMWPSECEGETEEPEKNEEGGLFKKIRNIASKAAAWVRGDEEEEDGPDILFEDHT